MAGPNYGTPSLVAWPLVANGVALYLAIDDDRAREAMCTLAETGIVSGES